MIGRILCGLAWLVPVLTDMNSQALFTEKGQVFTILREESAFSEMQIDPGNGAIGMGIIRIAPEYTIDALGYRRTDRLIYGISTANQNLFRIDANGMLEDLGVADVSLTLDYLAGDISPDGRTFIVIGSANGFDVRLYLIDLLSPTYDAIEIMMPGVTYITDIAFDPTAPDFLYGYDALNRSIVTINLNTFGIAGLSGIAPDNDVFSVYFDAFGRLYALGTSTSGVAGALFNVDKQTGVLVSKATGPVNRITDLAGIPYSVEMESIPSVRVAFPCEEVIYSFSIVNRTGVALSGVEFDLRFPAGIAFNEVVSNPFGGNITLGTPGHLRIGNMQLLPGLNEILVKTEIGNVNTGNYWLQGHLLNLPERHGIEVLSDDPETTVLEDSTRIRINRIDEDSIVQTRFLCLGESLMLDGGEYGNELLWSTGSTESAIEVTAGGQYVLQVQGGCQQTIVIFNVTAATCPFTIEVMHEMIPSETVPCSEVLFRFTFDNSSGAAREDLIFTDTLPAGLEFIGIATNGIGGTLIDGSSPQHIRIEDIDLSVGIHVLDLRIAIGDVPPGDYLNQGILQNLPTELGPRRYSDNPKTPELDSTPLIVLGVETDTLFINEIICNGSTLVLDGSPYGLVYQWFNGTTAATQEVTRPGIYELIVFDGCEPTYIYFDVDPAAHIEVSLDSSAYSIHLGDTLSLSLSIDNGGDLLEISWVDPQNGSLNCDTCQDVLLFPKGNARYKIYASNEHCTDSITAYVYVDKTRFLFVPNLFSPNHDGLNDLLTMFSPDPGWIETFVVSDRWGNVVFETGDMLLNDSSIGWDGTDNDEPLPAGVYIWSARIRFLDDEREWFAGDVVLLR